MFLWHILRFSVILDAGKRRLARIANPGRGGRLCPPGRNAIDLTKIPGESVCTHAYPVGADAGHSRSRRRSVTDVGLPLAGTHRPGRLHRFYGNLRRIRNFPTGRCRHRPLQPNAQVHTDSPWIFEKSTAFGGRTEASAPTNTLNISHKKTERNANYDL